MSLETNCPSCGAKIVFRSSASVVAVCEYCRSTLVRHDVDLQQVGKMADLKADGSRSSSAPAAPIRACTSRRRADSIPLRAGSVNEWYLVFDDMRGGCWARRAAITPSRSHPGLRIDSFFGSIKSAKPSCSTAAHRAGRHSERPLHRRRRELPFRVGAGYGRPS